MIFVIYYKDINHIKSVESIQPMDHFFILDKDNNGAIEINEFFVWFESNFDDHQIAMLHFQRSDTNADGRIDPAEFRTSSILKLMVTESVKKDL